MKCPCFKCRTKRLLERADRRRRGQVRYIAGLASRNPVALVKSAELAALLAAERGRNAQ